MPATILNTAVYTNTTALPITLSAGSNRRIIVDEFRITGAGNVTAGTGLTLGGVAGRFDGGATANTAYARNAVRKYSWGEAEIAAMSGNTLATVGGSGGTVRFLAYSIQGASQSDAATSNFTHNAAPAVGTGSISLSRTDNGFTCANLAFGLNVNATMANPTKAVSGTSNNEHVGYQSDNSGTAAAATFSGNSGLTPYSHLIVNYKSVPTQSITSINDDDEINAGAVNTAEVVGYVVGVNPVVSGTVGSLALTSVSQTGTGVTFTPPEPTNAAYWPEPDATQTLTLTDGTNPSTFNAPFRPLAGYTSIVVASPDNVDQYKLGYWATTPPVNGDRIMADFTVNPDTSFEGATDGLHIWYHWVNATSTMYIYEATIGGGVINSNRAITMRPISASGIIMRPITMRGM